VNGLNRSQIRSHTRSHTRFCSLFVSTPIWMRLGCMLLLANMVLPSVSAWGQLVTKKPAGLDQVGIDERLNELIPGTLDFRDDRGREVTLARYFERGRPVILTLNYATCPLLCQLQLEGLIRSLRDLQWNVGEEFDVLTVSIDPSETWQQAALAKKRHVQSYGRAGTAAGWHFLTGSDSNIRQLADAVGFRYRFVEEQGEYAHTAALMICTPEGRVSRYLYGVEYPPQTVRLSLVEAAEGKIGSTLDQVLLFCFHYDAEAGRYGPSARRMMQLGGFVTILVLLATLLPYWFFRRDRGPHATHRDTTLASAPAPFHSSLSQG
jgi:protein SCO1